MPRRIPIESRSSQTPDPFGPGWQRRQWLNHWKSVAVAKLQVTVPPAVRVKLRQAAEDALASYTPESAAAEIDDVITMLVEQALAEHERETTATRRAMQKQALLDCADTLLTVFLNRFPREFAGAAGSDVRRGRLHTLRPALRTFLEECLTGDEGPAELIPLILEWLAHQVLTYHPPGAQRRLLRIFARWALPVATAALGAGLAAHAEPVRAAMRKAYEAAKTGARAALPHVLEILETVAAAYAQARTSEAEEKEKRNNQDQEKEPPS